MSGRPLENKVHLFPSLFQLEPRNHLNSRHTCIEDSGGLSPKIHPPLWFYWQNVTKSKFSIKRLSQTPNSQGWLNGVRSHWVGILRRLLKGSWLIHFLFPLLPDKTDKIATTPAVIRDPEASLKKTPLLRMVPQKEWT